MAGTRGAEELLRELAPQVLGVLVRRHGQLDVCEDAVQEALLDAWGEWARRGVPEHPRGWLLTVAERRLIDRVRSDAARRRREDRLLLEVPPAEPSTGDGDGIDRDDSLILLYLCCHPTLSPPSQIALTLRAVGGLSTSEIAAAFFVPEATMGQRISRAKQRIREVGAVFSMPPPEELGERTRAVRHVLYLIFNAGYTSPGPSPSLSASPSPGASPSPCASVGGAGLTTEAIRLTRQMHRLRPDDQETKGLLALMLLTEARRPARTTSDGDVVPLAQQDRGLWNKDLIQEGVTLVSAALSQGPIGAYQLQAAIAAVHDEAEQAADTDWPQVLCLYELLDRISPNPMATLNRAVAVAMVHGPAAGLDLLAKVADDPRVSAHHLLYAVRGHLLDMAGDSAAAAESFEIAARRTASLPEKRYLHKRAHEIRTRLR